MKYELNDEQVKVIVAALGELKLREALPVFNAIMNQRNAAKADKKDAELKQDSLDCT